VSVDPLAQNVAHNVVSCWYDGWLTVHDNNQLVKGKPVFIGRRQIKVARCCCFVESKPGLLAIGTSSGAVYFVNITALLKGQDVYCPENKQLNERMQEAL